MISALDEIDSIVRCIEAGAVDYLPKPFAPALLRARIRASLENKLLRDRERAMMEEIQHRQGAQRGAAAVASCRARWSSASTTARRWSPTISRKRPSCSPTSSISRRSPARLLAVRCGRRSQPHLLGLRPAGRSVSARRRSRPSATATWWRSACPEPREDHAAVAARLSLRCSKRSHAIRSEIDAPIQLRDRHAYRTCDRGRDRRAQIRLRHLGHDGEYREPHGIARRCPIACMSRRRSPTGSPASSVSFRAARSR